MLKLAKELEFISQINRDGSGTTPISAEYLKILTGDKFNRDDEIYELKALSMSEGTYIAFRFNAFVVKLKKQ